MEIVHNLRTKTSFNKRTEEEVLMKEFKFLIKNKNKESARKNLALPTQ